MKVTWGSQRGDPAQLAIRMQLVADPDGGRAADPVMASSWGSFSLWAGGVNVTAFSDGQETHDAVNWYLLPLLEWFVANWDPLFHEEKLPCRVAADDAASSLAATAFPPARAHDGWEAEWQSFWRRHALQSARAGGPFPDLVIRRWRDQLETSWRSVAPAGIPEEVRFLATNGHARCDAMRAASVIHEVIGDAIAELRRLQPTSERLSELEGRFQAIESTPDAVRLHWLAGLKDRYSEIMDAVQQRAGSVADLFMPSQTGDLIVRGSCHGTLLFGSVAPSVATEDVLVIAKQMANARSSADGRSAPIDALCHSVPLASRYEVGPQGERLAAELRDHLSLPEDSVLPDLESQLESLGIMITDVDLTDRGLRGVSFAGDGLAPSLLVNTRAHAGFYDQTRRRRRRFTLAHELCHLLYDRDRGARLAIASGPWAPADVERRANAFAAGLLMPEDAVAVAVAACPELETLDGVRAVAETLDASISATIARLHVLGHIDDETEDYLKDQLGTG